MPKPLKEMEEKVKRNVKRIEGGEKNNTSVNTSGKMLPPGG